MTIHRIALSIVLLGLLAGCRGVPLKVPGSGIAPGEVAIGPVTGECTGVMLFQFIPINQNERFTDAYEQALASAPGATRVVDITIQENWFWAWLLNGYQFKLTGTAVKAK